MRHEKSKRSILKYTISEIISKIIDNLFDLSPKIEEDPLSIFDTKMEVLVLYANGSLKIFIFLKIPHRITFLTLRQRCRWVITYKSFCAFRDFYFRQESNHFQRKESSFSSERLTESQETEAATAIKRFAVARTTRLISLAFRDRGIDSHGCPLKIHRVHIYIYIYICTRWKSADRRNKSGRLICGPGRRQLICLLFTGSRRGENNERTRTVIITMRNEDLIYTADRLEPINSVTITSPRFSMKREWCPLYGLAVCGQFKKLERISLFVQLSMCVSHFNVNQYLILIDLTFLLFSQYSLK